eukprot:TRINITY_DN3350_c0_g1_i1.p1 TRINITY_DN3350_c0_g1~~TRINITY_DN3350_c0_g1_i1.p1  ORF type:complete len:255 (-),score=48.09 TRINITY_DN3350_c0_g1_i1:22-786(-)
MEPPHQPSKIASYLYFTDFAVNGNSIFMMFGYTITNIHFIKNMKDLEDIDTSMAIENNGRSQTKIIEWRGDTVVVAQYTNLRSLTEDDALAVRAHSEEIRGIAIDEEFVYSVGNDCCLKIWNKNLKLIKAINAAHDERIYRVLVSDDHIITCGADEYLKIWDKKTYQCLQKMHQKSSVLSCALFGNFLFAGLHNGTVTVNYFNGNEYVQKNIITFSTDDPIENLQVNAKCIVTASAWAPNVIPVSYTHLTLPTT